MVSQQELLLQQQQAALRRKARTRTRPVRRTQQQRREQSKVISAIDKKIKEAEAEIKRLEKINEQRIEKGLSRDKNVTLNRNIANRRLNALKQVKSAIRRGANITIQEAERFAVQRARSAEQRFQVEGFLKQKAKPLTSEEVEQKALEKGAIGQTKEKFIFPGGQEISKEQFKKTLEPPGIPAGAVGSKFGGGFLFGTTTEQELQQSLPSDLKDLSPAEIKKQQSLAPDLSKPTKVFGSESKVLKSFAGFSLFPSETIKEGAAKISPGKFILGVAPETPLEEAPRFVKEPFTITGRGTQLTKSITAEQLEQEKFFSASAQLKSRQIITAELEKSKSILKNRINQLQERINRGDISQKKAEEEIEKFIDKETQRLESRTKPKLKKIQEGLDKQLDREFVKRTLIDFAVITTGFILAPPSIAAVGSIPGLLQLGDTVFTKEGRAEFTESAERFPLSTGTAIAGSAATLGVGLSVGGRVGLSRVKAAQVESAINRSLKVSRGKFIGLEEAVRRFNFNPNRIPELIGRDTRNIKVRRVTVKIVPRSTADKKLIPRVRQEILEFAESDGRVIASVRRGTASIERGSRNIQREIIGAAVGKIEGETLKITSTTQILKFDIKKGFIPVEELTTLETLKGRVVTEAGAEGKIGMLKIEKITGEGDINLVRRTKFGRIVKFGRKDKPKSIQFLDESLGKQFFELEQTKIPTQRDAVKFKDISGTDAGLDIRLGVIAGRFKSTLEKPLPKEPLASKKPPTPLSKTFKEQSSSIIKKGDGQILEVDTKLQSQLFGAGIGDSIASAKTLARQFAVKTRFKITSGLIPRVKSINIQKEDTRITKKQEQVESQLSRSRQRLSQQTLNVTKQTSQFKTLADTSFRLGQSAQFKPSQIQSQKLSMQFNNFFDVSFPTVPFKPVKPGVFIFPDIDSTKGIRTEKRKVPYDVFIKKRKIADNLRKNKALDFGAFVTDNAIEAQFRIKRSKGKVKSPPFPIPPNYFNLNRNKFRSFKIRKGKRIPLKNTFIEKRSLRLDRPGEVQDITAARLIKQRKKLFRSSMFDIRRRNSNIDLTKSL